MIREGDHDQITWKDAFQFFFLDFAFAQLHEKATRRIAGDFLRALAVAVNATITDSPPIQGIGSALLKWTDTMSKAQRGRLPHGGPCQAGEGATATDVYLIPAFRNA